VQISFYKSVCKVELDLSSLFVIGSESILARLLGHPRFYINQFVRLS